MPLQFRPWDRPSSPNDPVASVDDAAKRLNTTLLNLARGEGDLAERVGYRAPGNGQKESRHTIEEKKRREAEAKFAADQARKALDERIRWLKEQIEDIKEKRAAIAERRTEIADKIAAIDELKKRLARGEKLDPNSAADRELARRAGISPEDLRRDDLADFLTIQRAGAVADDQDLARRDADLARKQGDFERDLGEAEGLAAEFRANPDSPEIQAKIAGMTGTTEDIRDLAWATSLTDSTKVKTSAAAAVAKAEDADVQKESAAFNAEVVSDVSAVTDTGTADFDFDAAPPTSSVAEGVAPTPIAAPPLTPQFAMAADPASVAPQPDEPSLAVQPGSQPVRSFGA